MQLQWQHFSGMSASLLAVILGLCCCSQASSRSVGTPRLFGPSEALAKRVLTLHCELEIVPEDEYILLELFKEDSNKSLAMYTIKNMTGASFPLVARTSYEGELVCVARSQNSSDIEPTFSNRHYLRVIEPVKGAQIDVQSGQLEFFEGKPLEMNCKLRAGTHVYYTWHRDGQIITPPLQNSRFIISRPTSEDSGAYMCIANNFFNGTLASSVTSNDVFITVKDVVSSPDISYTVLREDSQNYSALVTCESIKGTQPITFSLYEFSRGLVGTATVEERKITFKIPVKEEEAVNVHCEANNGNLTVESKTIVIEVVSVGGPVKFDYEADVGDNYAVVGVRFSCRAARGSHPHFQWFLNNTLLEEKGGFYRVYHSPPWGSLLHLAVGRSSAGTYHCEVSDSFDNTTAISSKGLYMDRDVLNWIDTWVVVIVFGSFTLVVLLVSICCFIGVLFRQYEEKSLLDLEMENMVARFGDKVDESEYCEDADVVQAARAPAEPDQASEGSVDEWPQIEEEKKTLEDEPVEEP